MAVHNEERAFAFWSYVAAHAGSAEIRRAAEAMAHEELGHVSLLRRERRKAFHAERERPGSDAAKELRGHDLSALERRLAGLLERLAGNAPAEARAQFMDAASDARRHAEELDRFPMTMNGILPTESAGDDPVALAEFLTDHYLEAGDNLHDEQMLRRVQVMAGRAIRRLAWLRADLPELQKS
jgi:hypothetical protein